MAQPVTACLAAALVVLAAVRVDAAAPVLAKGQKVYNGDAVLRVSGGHATPEVVDWNEDGRPDILVGQFDNGYLNLLLNQSTNPIPLFDGATLVESAGTPIQADWG